MYSSNVNAQALSLLHYAELALEKSGASLDMHDTLELSKIDVALADDAFSMQVVPLASLGVRSGSGTQNAGLEVRKKTEFGMRIAAGVEGSRQTSDVYQVTNPDTVRTYVRLSQGLFRNWGTKYNRSGLTIAELQRQKQVFRSRQASQEVLLNAVQHYYDVLLSERLVEQSRKSLDRIQQHLKAVQARYAIGLVPKTDVLQAKIALLNAESAWRNQEQAQKSNIDAFYEHLSMETSDAYTLEEQMDKIYPVIPQDWNSLLPEQSLDWQAYLTDRELSSLNLYVARRNTLPDLSMDVEVAKRGSAQTFANAARMNQTDWLVQFTLSSSISNFRDRSNLKREQIQATQLERTGSRLERKIMRTAKRAMQNLQAEEGRLQISFNRQRQAEQALELVNIRYTRGLASNLDVLDAETTYAESSNELLRGRVAYNMAAVKLAQALGILDLDWLKLSLESVHE